MPKHWTAWYARGRQLRNREGRGGDVGVGPRIHERATETEDEVRPWRHGRIPRNGSAERPHIGVGGELGEGRVRVRALEARLGAQQDPATIETGEAAHAPTEEVGRAGGGTERAAVGEQAGIDRGRLAVAVQREPVLTKAGHHLEDGGPRRGRGSHTRDRRQHHSGCDRLLPPASHVHG